MQCHLALDASGKQGSRKIMFGVAAVGYFRFQARNTQSYTAM
jgi:hypothetical protein